MLLETSLLRPLVPIHNALLCLKARLFRKLGLQLKEVSLLCFLDRLVALDCNGRP